MINMKKSIILSIQFLFFCTFSMAQSSEVNQSMSLGIQTGVHLSIAGADEKLIEKEWKKYTKEFGKLERNKKADEYFLSNVTIHSIRSESMDVYSKIRDNSIITFFDLKNGFLNSKDQTKEFPNALQFMTEFGYEVQREMIRQELDDENDKLKKSMRGMDKLKKDNVSYHQDIEEAKAKIKKAENNIEANEKEQVKAKAEIEAQVKVVEQVQKKLDSVGKSK